MLPNGLKPSNEKPNLTFRDSLLKEGYILSNDFHASVSSGCLSTPSCTHFSLCHLISLVVCLDLNSHCNLGLRRKIASFL